MKFISENIKIEEWSYDEDTFLSNIVESQREQVKWTKVARQVNNKFFGGEPERNAKQVKRRWENVLKSMLM